MQLTIPDFTECLPMLAEHFQIKPRNHHFSMNSSNGKGYYWVERLPSGITIMVSDTCLANQIEIERAEAEQHHFILQFNEEAADERDENVKKRRNADEYESFVKLSHTWFPENFVFPATKRLRSVKFFFTKDHLLSLLGKEAAGEMLANYFPLEYKCEQPEPITSEYRVMLDDLLIERVEQPLRLNYIQNRVLLLLERYVVKLHERRQLQTDGKRAKKSFDELLRLMKVEALLVKDFSSAPPTIDELSRISAMSATKLKYDFKAQYGLAIYEYFQKNRMLKAKSLLAQKQYTIKEVGKKVGYSNLSHFATGFRKQFGHLPSENAAKDNTLVYGNS